MPPRTPEERERRKLEAQKRKEARKAAKEKNKEETGGTKKKDAQKKGATSSGDPKTVVQDSVWLKIPDDALHQVFIFLTARDLGCISMVCRQWNVSIAECRVTFLMSRLHRPKHNCEGTVGYTDICQDQNQARKLLEQSFEGETDRLISKKSKKSSEGDADEFIAYARFLEEGVCGHAPLNVGGADPPMVSKFVNGRFASVSPEHSLCRVGGDGHKSGAGGSGVASWGVGKRGQLGHGKRDDEPLPKRMLSGIGYGIRIVQVSAGGGLVRVAHSLLLTSTGRVLSFGTGQYGQLGHGYSDGKQLPDMVRPKYIEAFNGTRIVSVCAGELHSAAINEDGDLYTWGDGFCGQLGHGDKRPQVSPKQVMQGGMEDESVANVSCGNRHTICITEDGEAFSFGLGHFGVLGRSFTPFEYDADAAVMAMGGDLEEDEGFAPVAPQNPPAVPPAPVDDAAALAMHLDLIANLTLDDPSDQCIPKLIDSLKGVKIVGSSCGHRHSLLLDEHGGLYSMGSGKTGALGLGDTESHMFPMKVMSFVDDGLRVMQVSAGVDLSMAVTTNGDVYSWGKCDGGRNGLGMKSAIVSSPRKVSLMTSKGEPLKAIDVECGYVHCLIVGANGTLHLCGGVGTDGQSDGQAQVGNDRLGKPVEVENFNIWHRLAEPKAAVVKAERWKKYGKYELKGRSKMMAEANKYGTDS